MFIDETTHIASQLRVSHLRSPQSLTGKWRVPSFVYGLPEFHGGLQLETDKPFCQVLRARSTVKGLHGRTKPFKLIFDWVRC